MEGFLQYIGEFGFTVFVAVYLLIRMEQKLDKLTESIQNLNTNIEKIEK